MRITVILAALLLSGCSGGGSDPAGPGHGDVLAPNTGGIQGLLVDDVYRPIKNAEVILFPLGLTVTTDRSGQFEFRDLTPGTYNMRLDSPAHEAAPVTVDVAPKLFTEVEFSARRIINDEGRIITTFYSVFVPCAVSTVERTQPLDCTFDTSDETGRFGFESNYVSHGANLTYLVTEMKAGRAASPSQGAYKVVVRDASGTDPYFASGFVTDTDYLRLTMHVGTISLDDAEPGRNKNWTNTKAIQTAFFPQGGFKSETQQVLDAQCPSSGVCGESRGLGPQFGVKATFLATAFIGEPKDPIEEYHPLQG